MVANVGEPRDAMDIIVDTGACVHVAPRDYAKHVALENTEDAWDLQSVTGKQLRVYGQRRVRFLLEAVDGW